MTRGLRSLLGLLTLAACGLGLRYLFHLMDPAVTRHDELLVGLRFAEAGNLVAGAPVRIRGVQVGDVRSVDLLPDGSGVLAEVAIGSAHHHLVRRGSRFWIVRPRFEGITRGIEGLDTLLRNPYVVFDTPADGEQATVEAGQTLAGLPGPPQDQGVPPPEAGDLRFSVHFARSFGIEPGAPVLLRDIRVGEVHSVELDSGGQWSSLELAIRSRYRQTVRTGTVFWIQKPTVQSGWLASNIRANELGSLLSGPAVTYFTPQDALSPLGDGAVVRGQLEPAEIPETLSGPMVYVPPRSETEASRLAAAATQVGAELAGILYSFDESGVLSRTRYERNGTVLLLRCGGGKLKAITTRSLSEGRYTVSDLFSPADVSGQAWELRGASGWRSGAKPVWRAARDADLAGLEVQAELGTRGLELSALGPKLDPASRVQLVAFRGAEAPEFLVLPGHTAGAAVKPGVYPIGEDHARSLAAWEGAVALDMQGRPVGMLGRVKPLSEQPALVGFELLDAELKGQAETPP